MGPVNPISFFLCLFNPRTFLLPANLMWGKQVTLVDSSLLLIPNPVRDGLRQHLRVPIAVRNTITRSNSGRKGFLQLTVPDHTPSPKQVRAGAWRQELQQDMEEHCLLVCSPWLARSGFLQHHDYLPRIAVPTIGWTLPYHSWIKKMNPSLPTGQFDEGALSVEVHLPR